MKTILEFAFHTGDSTCRYWQEWVVVTSERIVNYEPIRAALETFMENEVYVNNSYSDIVESVMKQSGYNWYFILKGIPECQTIHTFWV